MGTECPACGKLVEEFPLLKCPHCGSIDKEELISDLSGGLKVIVISGLFSLLPVGVMFLVGESSGWFTLAFVILMVGLLGIFLGVVMLILSLVTFPFVKFGKLLFTPSIQKMHEKKDISGLIKATGHPDNSVRQAAKDALEDIGWRPDQSEDRDVKALIAVLKGKHKDADQDARVATAKTLGQIGTVQAVKSLIAALKDDDADVCKAAAAALGQIGNVKAVKPLIKTLKDPDIDLRKIAAQALDNIGWEPDRSQDEEKYRIAKSDTHREVSTVCGICHRRSIEGEVTTCYTLRNVGSKVDRYSDTTKITTYYKDQWRHDVFICSRCQKKQRNYGLIVLGIPFLVWIALVLVFMAIARDDSIDCAGCLVVLFILAIPAVGVNWILKRVFSEPPSALEIAREERGKRDSDEFSYAAFSEEELKDLKIVE